MAETIRRTVTAGLVALVTACCAAGGAEQQETQYSLSAGIQQGSRVVWRMNQATGQVSLCIMPKGDKVPTCSLWSERAPAELGDSFDLNAEYAKATTAWVWRISRDTGQVSMCTLQNLGRLASLAPECSPWSRVEGK